MHRDPVVLGQIPADEISLHELTDPALRVVRPTPRVRLLAHLLAGGTAGLIVGCLDGYLASTRSGLAPLTASGHRASVLIAISLTVVAFAGAGLAVGLLQRLASRWRLGAPIRAVLRRDAVRGAIFGAALALVVGGAIWSQNKAIQWAAIDWRLPGLLLGGLIVYAAVLRGVRRTSREYLMAGLLGVSMTFGAVATGWVLLGEARGDGLERVGTESAISGRILARARLVTDADGDGHPTSLCVDDCDCDDSDPAVHPDAHDVPDNGVDEDCDGVDASASAIAEMQRLLQRVPLPRPAPVPPAPVAEVAPPSSAPATAHEAAAASAVDLDLTVEPEPDEPPVVMARRAPNVVFIVVDTLRADHLGAYGYERPTSPNIDRLAEGGVVFDQARAAGSQTRFSVPPMLVGKYFTEIARTAGKWPVIAESETLVAERFAAAGYDTAAVHSISYFRRWSGMAQGFEHYDVQCIKERSPWRKYATSDCVTDRALRWLDRRGSSQDQAERPFFLWAYYGDPHAPYLRHASVDNFGSTTKDRYDEEVVFTDRHIGRLLDALEERGLADDTIVVLTSDHGEGLDEHEDHGHLFHGPTLYDEVIRVPLIVRGPGFASRRVSTPVSLIDLPPTFGDILGQELDPSLRGVSLTPWLRGEDPEHPPVFFEKQKESALPQKGMVLWPYKVILVLPYNRLRIYDLERDPQERNELKKELPPEEVRRLVGLLKYWSNDVLVPVEPTPP